MKDQGLTRWFVLTADQIASRRHEDAVPTALEALAALSPAPRLGFERTVGDEIQALADDPATIVAAVLALTRLDGWRIGIGLGSVDEPLPVSTRAARGSAYVAARDALGAARNSPTDLAVRAGGNVGADPYREAAVTDAETALILLRWVVQRRTPEGWELLDLLARDPVSRHAAATLGISPSAVSQRLTRSAHAEAQRGTELAVRLLRRAGEGE